MDSRFRLKGHESNDDPSMVLVNQADFHKLCELSLGLLMDPWKCPRLIVP